MMIKLNKPLAFVLLVLLTPIVLPIKLWKFIRGERKPFYENTIAVEPLKYSGDKPLVVAVWVTWASVWRDSTEKIIAGLKETYAGKCEFYYIEGSNRKTLAEYNVDVLPAVLVFQGGKEVGRFINMYNDDEIKTLINRLTTPS